MTSIKNLPNNAKGAPVRFLKYTSSTTIFSKNIAYIPNLTVMTEFWSNLPDYLLLQEIGVAECSGIIRILATSLEVALAVHAQ